MMEVSMSWNYRVIDFGDHAALHEVHYGADGSPVSYAEAPADFSAWRENGDDPVVILEMLERAADGARKPTLQVTDFTIGDA